MKAYISIKYRAGNSNKECIDKISAALERNGFETVCIARDIEKWGEIELSPHELMQRAFAEIDSSNLLVVDLTEKGGGVGHRSGICIRQANSDSRNRAERLGHFNDATGNCAETVLK